MKPNEILNNAEYVQKSKKYFELASDTFQNIMNSLMFIGPCIIVVVEE